MNHKDKAEETNPNIADWQVKQAADAIFLYSEKFLKQSDEKARVVKKKMELRKFQPYLMTEIGMRY